MTGSPFEFSKGSSAPKLSASSEHPRQRTVAHLAAAFGGTSGASTCDASQLAPAIHSLDGTSLEVSFPFSAMNLESPLLVGESSNAALVDGAGLASPAAFPPSGFLTLLAAFSSPGLAGLFHPASALGVSALQSFSLRSSRVASSATSCPPDVHRCGVAATTVRLQGFAPLWSPLAGRRVSTAFPPRCSLGLLSLQGSLSRQRDVDFATSPLLDFFGSVFCRGCPRRLTFPPVLQSLCFRRARLASLESCRPSWDLRPPAFAMRSPVWPRVT